MLWQNQQWISPTPFHDLCCSSGHTLLPEPSLITEHTIFFHALHGFLAAQKISHCAASDMVADDQTTLEELQTVLTPSPSVC